MTRSAPHTILLMCYLDRTPGARLTRAPRTAFTSESGLYHGQARAATHSVTPLAFATAACTALMIARLLMVAPVTASTLVDCF